MTSPSQQERAYPKTTRFPNDDAKIVRMYRKGIGAGQIAKAIKRSQYFVLCRLRCNGIERRPSGAPDPQWHQSEVERRESVARNAASGASETLRGVGTFKSLGEALKGVVE